MTEQDVYLCPRMPYRIARNLHGMSHQARARVCCIGLAMSAPAKRQARANHHHHARSTHINVATSVRASALGLGASRSAPLVLRSRPSPPHRHLTSHPTAALVDVGTSTRRAVLRRRIRPSRYLRVVHYMLSPACQ